MMGDGACPNHQTLMSFLLGKLPPEQEKAVNLHLEACAACETRAQHIEPEAEPLIDALQQTLLPPGGPVDVTVKRLAAALPVAPFHLEGYQIHAEIGRGGMGVVYRAYQQPLNRMVAIKMILAGQLARPEDRVRFHLEGELLARLHHANFVQVYEVGTVEVGPATVQPYLVLEYIDGGSLKARLGDKPLAFREAAQLALVLARAMAVAHAQGILHRDLKPANVLVARDGTLKITDFGLAKELGTGVSLTHSGLAIGTPSYMAPEQARASAHVGPATDVYALGAILYEMLTGRPPFAGEAAAEVMVQVLENTPAPASRLRAGIPRDLETICLKCLEKEPRARYARAADLADDLECWLENRPIRARPVGRVERAVKWARRHPLPAALLAFLLLSLVLGSAASTYFGVTAVSRAHEAQLALGREEAARQRAEQATEAERWERYLAEIAAASNALQLQNVGPAERALEAAPARYRNWEWQRLHNQLDGARTVLRGHSAAVSSAVFSPDGKRVAAGSADQTVCIWDVAGGPPILVLRVPTGRLAGVQYSPDGRRLITGGDAVRLWDVRTGELLGETPAKDKIDLTWSADGRYFAGSDSGQLTVWDAVTGKVIFAQAKDAQPRAIALSPDGKHVAVNRDDHTVAVYETAGGKEVAVLRGHSSGVSHILYSPDGRRIATGSVYRENQVRLWDAATGTLLHQGDGHDNEVSVLAFSPDGRYLASGSMDYTVRIWDGQTGEARAKLEGHTGFVNDLAFSPDGSGLVSASSDQTLRLWDPAAGRLITVLRGHTAGVGAVGYGVGGALIASGSADGTVRLWEAELVARTGVLRGHERYVYDVAFRPDGGEVASAGWDGAVRLWDPTTGRETGAPLTHATPIVIALNYSPDGRQLAAIVREEGVWLWDLSRRKPIRLWKRGESSWEGDSHVAFHPDGKLLAWGSRQGPVYLWDPTTGEELPALAGHDSPSRDVAFRPDGKQLASADADGKVRLWDVASRQPAAVLHGPKDIQGLAYSADGRLLAAGAATNAVAVWQVEPPKELGVFPLGSVVYGVAFSPDGTRLACACADNTIRLWDVARLREVAELRGHRNYVHAVKFSPDGTRLASASGDFTVRIWDTLRAQDRAPAGPP